MSYEELEALVTEEPAAPTSRPSTGPHLLPAQEVRRFVEQFFIDPGEVDDVVEEVLAVCVEDFAGVDHTVPVHKWVMVVASRVVAGRWRRRNAVF